MRPSRAGGAVPPGTGAGYASPVLTVLTTEEQRFVWHGANPVMFCLVRAGQTLAVDGAVVTCAGNERFMQEAIDAGGYYVVGSPDEQLESTARSPVKITT